MATIPKINTKQIRVVRSRIFLTPEQQPWLRGAIGGTLDAQECRARDKDVPDNKQLRIVKREKSHRK